jgi:hypothetical protein
VKVSDLVGVAEIAERLGVEPTTVHKWTQRYDDFPAGLVHLKGGTVWAWPDVAAWANRRGRGGR